MGHLHRLARRARGRLTAAAAGRSALLSLLFVAVYTGCNWLASQRTDVGTWYFAWERHLPFWPVLIVPYLSIDAFFVAAPFLCRDRDELRVFTGRVAAAIVAAGICFVLMPLRFAFERPETGGWLGALFHGFAQFDRPFNLVPSLHITLAVILADTYRRHSRGVVRAAVTIWFVLIGLSTVFTYQHHVIDVAGGLVLATLVFYGLRLRTALHQRGESRGDKTTHPVFPPDNSHGSPWALGVGSWEVTPVALYYATGATLSVIGAVLMWPWGAPLLWPALSLTLVAGAYAGLGTWVFEKSGGRLPLATRLVLWPYLLGQRASLLWYQRQCRPHDAVTPRLWIGRRLSEREAAAAVAAGVSAVVDLTADFDEPPAFTALPYLNLPTLDLTAPGAEAIDQAVRFVREHSRDGIVYVHCKIGYSRSAAVVAACLLAAGDAATADDAVDRIREVRPRIVVRPEIVRALRQYEHRLTHLEATSEPAVSPVRLVVSQVFALAARGLVGTPRWNGAALEPRPRVYFANHTSHLDFVAIWGSLPPAERVRTRPVAGRDYWERGPIRRVIGSLIGAVLVDRADPGADRITTIRAAERGVGSAVRALDGGASLIIFPEGTRGSGGSVGAFKSGLYHLCRVRPDTELVPVLLGDMHRILPKGETVPLPLAGSITFGASLRLRPGEDKAAFLARARAALLQVSEPCSSLSTRISQAS